MRRRYEREVKTPGGVLNILKNKILRVMRIDDSRFNILIERYANLMRSLNQGGPSNKGNLKGAFRRDEISIITFFRFLSAVGAKKVKFEITIITDKDEEYKVEEEVELISGGNDE